MLRNHQNCLENPSLSMTSSLILKQFNFQYQCIWFKKISFHYYSWNYDMLKDLQKLAFSPLPLLFTIHMIPQNSGKGSVISLWRSVHVSCSRAVLFVVIALTHTQAASHMLQVESLQILDLDWFSKKKKKNLIICCCVGLKMLSANTEVVPVFINLIFSVITCNI